MTLSLFYYSRELDVSVTLDPSVEELVLSLNLTWHIFRSKTVPPRIRCTPPWASWNKRPLFLHQLIATIKAFSLLEISTALDLAQGGRPDFLLWYLSSVTKITVLHPHTLDYRAESILCERLHLKPRLAEQERVEKKDERGD